MRRAWSRACPYLIGVVVPTVVLLLVLILRPLLHIEPSPPFLAGVLVVAWIAGFWPAVVTAVVGVEMLNYFFVPPLGTLAIHNQDGGWMVLFLVVGVTVARLASNRKELLAQQSLARHDAQIARAEALEANRAKDVFLAVVSHELRSSLQSISGWMAVLCRDQVDAASRRQAIEAIERSVASQSRLIEDLLDLARVMAGKLTLERQDICLETVLKTSLEAVQCSAESRQLSVACFVDPRTPSVWGDPVRLQQVFVNLLSNAIKFTPRGGLVQITASAIGREIRVAVRDSGIGIAPDLIPRIFDRFVQVDVSRRQGGLGLGLTIVRHLVEAHGGRVEAESDGEGRGTTVTVVLPAAAPDHRTG